MLKIQIQLEISDPIFIKSFIRAAFVKGIDVKHISFHEFVFTSSDENKENFYEFLDSIGYDSEIVNELLEDI